MGLERQIQFLLKRFNDDKNILKTYVNDLCSTKKVKELSEIYGISTTQIQRDRKNCLERVVKNKFYKILDLY